MGRGSAQSAAGPSSPQAAMPPPAEGSCVWPLSDDVLHGAGLDAGNVSIVELATERLRALVSTHAVKHGKTGGVPSYSVRDVTGGADSDDSDDDDAKGGEKAQLRHTSLGLGVGAHAFDHHGETMWIVRQRQGAPVGTNCGAVYHTSALLVAQGAGREVELQALCDAIAAKAAAHVPNAYQMYQWNVDNGYWRYRGNRTARPVESVVLPKETKDSVVADMEEFLSKETKKFYMQHGIPYKRAYLFWGVPGTGKTSLIQALAGKWRRHICFMQPTDPKFTDDMLKQAVTTAPARSMLIFEDIDALFTKSRENRGKSAVTFSGLLNALDGVGMTAGQVFCLTSNFREQLDAALIRNGRVDVHVEFRHLADEESGELFRRFFPADAGLAADFVKKLRTELGSRADTLTPAVLQNFFIHERKNAGCDVIAHVPRILDEVRRREQEELDSKEDDGQGGGGKAKAKGDDSSAAGEQPETASKSAGTSSQPTHHWHLSVSASVALTVVGAICLPILCRGRGAGSGR